MQNLTRHRFCFLEESESPGSLWLQLLCDQDTYSYKMANLIQAAIQSKVEQMLSLPKISA